MRAIWVISIVLIGICAVAAGGTVYAADRAGYAPRDLARYIVHRAKGHRALIVKTALYVSNYLNKADRLSEIAPPAHLDWVGASASSSQTSSDIVGSYHSVYSMSEFLAALNAASPGDIIELQPGRYRIDGYGVRINRPGRPDAPIVVRAARLGDVVLESSAREAIKVSAPDWHFENLVVRGLCGPEDDSDCEHAFHIVGSAKRTVVRNNILIDFNAQIKINGEGSDFPDDGIIERNTLHNTRPRETANPVTPIDLDSANGWLIAGNFISDFVKLLGNGVSYGAFAKGAGSHNVFQRNVILCEDKLQGQPGERVGLSLGGGGSSPDIRREHGLTGLEQDNSQITDNLIAFCSNDGVYVNRSGRSLIAHNTLLDTSGIVIRFPQSSARLEANIVDGIIAVRDGASALITANQAPLPFNLYLGIHPQRQLFVAPARLDLRWRGAVMRGAISDMQPDLCGTQRALHPVVGAFENFADCLRHAPAAPRRETKAAL